MDRRSGDRRAWPRFDVFGELQGTLEMSHRLAVRNLSAGGALVDADPSYTVGSRLGGDLSYRAIHRAIRAEIRHASVVDKSSEERLVGLEFLDVSGGVDELLELANAGPPQAPLVEDERRRWPRASCAGCEIGLSRWLTVEIADIGRGGVLFLAPSPMSVGTRSELRMSLAQLSLSALVEVRRIERGAVSRFPYRIGASFEGLDERGRRALESFVGVSRRDDSTI